MSRPRANPSNPPTSPNYAPPPPASPPHSPTETRKRLSQSSNRRAVEERMSPAEMFVLDAKHRNSWRPRESRLGLLLSQKTDLGEKAEVAGRGQQGKGRGFDKGAIRVPKGYFERSGSHPLRIISISYGFPFSCHGRGRGFEPRRPRHKPSRSRVYGLDSCFR